MGPKGAGLLNGLKGHQNLRPIGNQLNLMDNKTEDGNDTLIYEVEKQRNYHGFGHVYQNCYKRSSPFFLPIMVPGSVVIFGGISPFWGNFGSKRGNFLAFGEIPHLEKF